MIPEDKVREVAERLSIVEVVSEYVQLRRSGSNFQGLCPFHSEKTPSFNVNPAREIFHCFGCGAGGNAFSFVMRMEGLSFPEAVKFLARKAGVEIEERQLTPAERKTLDEKQQFQAINELAANYYRSVLKNGQDGESARQYLSRRAVSNEIAETYRLGFAPDRSDGLARHLRNNGADLDLAGRLGLLRKSDSGWYDLFRKRLIFPIRDQKGSVIAFAGRVLDSSLPKYINSPESPIYHKSSVLFGLDMALPAVRVKNSLIIVEGYFDHLALYRAGVCNVVATCGTALTATHAGQIKRHAEQVHLLFDGDSAGKKASIRSMEIFLEQSMSAYVITLPPGEDPDSFLSKHPLEAFTERQNKARPAFDFFVRSLLAETPPDSVDNKVRVIDEIIPRFKKISDPIEKDLYEKEICRLLGITVHAFRKRLGGMPLTERTSGTSRPLPNQTGDNSQETLLTLVINYPEARDKAVQTGLDTLFSGDYLELAQLVIATMAQSDNSQVLSLLTDRIESDWQKKLLSKLMVSEVFGEEVDWRNMFDQCSKSSEKKALGSIKDIAARLAVLDENSSEYALLLQQADALRKRKSEL